VRTLGGTRVSGPEGVAFYTRAKAVTARWPHPARRGDHDTHLHFPTAV
jgi:malonate-semialdehyde dehydrogenase (acetylating)/methylmalonate-semialdehyde dehydrogenase